VILRNIFEQRVVRSDDVLGPVCGYLLAAGAWANLFMLIEIFSPGSFSVGPGFGAGLDTWDGPIAVLTYVSLGSLTSVGSGAVVPVQPPATILIPSKRCSGSSTSRSWLRSSWAQDSPLKALSAASASYM